MQVFHQQLAEGPYSRWASPFLRPRMSSGGNQAAQGPGADPERQNIPAAREARAVSDESRCISWDAAAASKPLDKAKKDLMTAKGLDREEGI